MKLRADEDKSDKVSDPPSSTAFVNRTMAVRKALRRGRQKVLDEVKNGAGSA